MFCPRASAHPRKCPALAACPAGSAVPGFNAGAFITIILVVLLYLATFFAARYFLRRRSSRRQQQQAARNQVIAVRPRLEPYYCAKVGALRALLLQEI